MAITVKTLDRKRKDYLGPTRSLYAALYEGGHRVEEQKIFLLPQRPAETQPLYGLRIAGFYYLNRVAKVVDEFAGSVFGGELQVLLEKEDPAKDRPPLPDEYTDFVADPKGDGEGSLEDVLFEAFRQAQVHRDYFFMPVFRDGVARDRDDQEKQGLLTPALRCIDADTVIHLVRDEFGLKSAMLRMRVCDETPLVEDEKREDTVRWTLIDRKVIRTWELKVKPNAEPQEKDEPAEQDPETHRWANASGGLGICPLVQLAMGKSTWLVDKVASVAVEDTRKRNALSWLEDLAAYPQPYHAGDQTLQAIAESGGDRATNKKRGAAYFFEIEKDDTLGYLEPTGAAFDHLAHRLEALGHEMAEIVHQAASALGPTAAAQVQSAASKMRDSVAKRLLAETYAADIRKAALEILRLVAIGRSEDHAWEIAGLEIHDIADADAVIDEALKVQAVEIPSPTFLREYKKRVALSLLPSASADTRDKITQEIEDAALAEPPPLIEPPEPEGGAA